MARRVESLAHPDFRLEGGSMHKRRLRTPSPALVISVLALFVALGGTSLAAAGFINGKHIKPHSIPTDRLTKGAIKTLQGAQGPPGPQGRRGLQGPKGDTGDIGPSNAYSGYFAPAYSVAGPYKKVVSQTLAAGSYLVAATTSIDMPNAEGTSCKLEDSIKGDLDESIVGALGPTALDESMSLLAPLTTTGSLVSVVCASNDPAATVSFTHIVAIKLGSVSGS
jgi:hypothetical protein